MTIWLLSIGNAGMDILLLTSLSSQRDRRPVQTAGPTPRGWSRPRKRTTDQGRFLTSLTSWSAFTVAGTAPDFRRLPFEPPPPSLELVGGTLVGHRATAAIAGLSNCQSPHYSVAMPSNHGRLTVLLSAIAAAAALRLVPHPPNFTPIGAMALFSGAYLGRRAFAFVAPFAAMLLSDAIIGFHSGMPFVYASVGLIVVLGWLTLSRVTVLRLGGAALASSVLFFAVTNFGTWVVSGMYLHSWSGL